jgi:GNAT superfamily N-acetyltransferase
MENNTDNLIHVEKIEDEQVLIRPISPNDAGLEQGFINNLSDQSKHYRFLGGRAPLSIKELIELCDIDYYSKMAFIALIDDGDQGTVIGVSRYAIDKDNESFEFAVTVADEWQNKGLGTLLMKHLIGYAKSHEIKQIYSIDLASNYKMRALANDLGMKNKKDPDDANQIIYSLTLD